MDILEQVTAAFAEADAQSIANVPAAVQAEREAYKKALADVDKEIDELGLSPHQAHKPRVRARTRVKATFSKSFLDDYDWGPQEHVARVVKQTQRTHEARNAKIAKKMIDSGIKNIDADDFQIVYGRDFSGLWIIDGFRVSIKVIWAGGYNIQCLHNRVLCQVKKAVKI